MIAKTVATAAHSPFAERKILGHLPIVGQYLSGGIYPPIQVEIDLTNRCTSNCPWCAGFQDREDHPFILFGTGSSIADQWSNSRDRVKELVGELASYEVKSLTWTGGGDPSVHPYLSEIIKHSDSLGLDNGLITNGVIDVSDCLPYCQWVRYSVDAATEDGYHKQHGREKHFHRVLSNILDATGKKRRDHLDTTIGVGFVTAPSVVNEIVPFVGLWRDIAVDYIQFRPIMSNYGREYETNNAEILEQIEAAQRIDPRVVKSDAKYGAMLTGETGMTARCHGTFFETAVAADGCVYTCCHLKSLPQYSLGSLHEESFAAIWERHLSRKPCQTSAACSTFCRHFGTNKFFEQDVLHPRTHENFI